jgi:protein TonB
MTVLIYLMLPFLERLSHPVRPDRTIRSVDTVELPPPVPPPRVHRERQQVSQEMPKPRLKQPRQPLMPLQMAVNLDLGDAGDFAIGLGRLDAFAVESMEPMVFELSDLDEASRPLARLRPVYPPQARLRRLEGEVVLEFIVEADGTTRDVQVVSGNEYEVFHKAAIRAIRRWRFSPGTRQGEPVAVRVRQKVTFSMD